MEGYITKKMAKNIHFVCFSYWPSRLQRQWYFLPQSATRSPKGLSDHTDPLNTNTWRLSGRLRISHPFRCQIKSPPSLHHFNFYSHATIISLILPLEAFTSPSTKCTYKALQKYVHISINSPLASILHNVTFPTNSDVNQSFSSPGDQSDIFWLIGEAIK